ncbi:hypothetical protein ABMA27_006964 [Loxostege sticticalis]|uniref:Farnesoic acid O-methyl transferase domain-containing protein n=1 Tax=Loxostege sticticalis TaxID=481309 RepID=A0ABR3IL56_LOXSC
MGDIIETSLRRYARSKFYKVSSSGVFFEVKSANAAAVGLAKKPGDTCDIWVVIGHMEKSWIKKRHQSGAKTVRTPNILNDWEYKSFWISWRNGVVQFGRGHETTPIVSEEYGEDLSYVTFSEQKIDYHLDQPVHWRFELPPACIQPEQPKSKSVSDGKLVWVDADNQSIPSDALLGGYENEPLYIIRGGHEEVLSPGKYVPSKRAGYITERFYDDPQSTHKLTEFQVLCGFDCTWVPIHTYGGRTPVSAVEAGSRSYRDNVYVGRAYYNGHLIPGKVDPSKKVCYICYEDKEVALEEFEILVDPNKNAHSANTVFLAHISINDAYYVPEIDFHLEQNFRGYHERLVPYDIDDRVHGHQDVAPNEDVDREEEDEGLGDFFAEDDH